MNFVFFIKIARELLRCWEYGDFYFIFLNKKECIWCRSGDEKLPPAGARLAILLFPMKGRIGHLVPGCIQWLQLKASPDSEHMYHSRLQIRDDTIYVWRESRSSIWQAATTGKTTKTMVSESLFGTRFKYEGKRSKISSRSDIRCLDATAMHTGYWQVENAIWYDF